MATLPESPDTTVQPLDELRTRLERAGSWDALGNELAVSVDTVIEEVREWLESYATVEQVADVLGDLDDAVCVIHRLVDLLEAGEPS